jgi:hypothetical protein
MSPTNVVTPSASLRSVPTVVPGASAASSSRSGRCGPVDQLPPGHIRRRRGPFGLLDPPRRVGTPRGRDATGDGEHGHRRGDQDLDTPAGGRTTAVAVPQRVGECLHERTGGGMALCRGLGEPLPEDSVHGRRQRGVPVTGARDLAVPVRQEQGHRRVLGVRRGAGEHLEGQAGERVEVGPVTDRLAGGLLRGHVPRGAQVLAAGGDGRVVQRLREPEVGEDRTFLLVDEDVGRLEVPVDDTAAVGVVQRLRQGRQQRECSLGRARPLCQVLLQGRARDQAHGEVQASVGLPRVVDRGDAGVLEAPQHPRLPEEPGHERVLQRQGRPEHLQGHRAGEAEMGRSVDLTHPASADEGLHDVGPHLGAGQDRGAVHPRAPGRGPVRSPADGSALRNTNGEQPIVCRSPCPGTGIAAVRSWTRAVASATPHHPMNWVAQPRRHDGGRTAVVHGRTAVPGPERWNAPAPAASSSP